MEFLQNIRLVWSKVNATQRILLIAVVMTAVGAGSLLVYWTGRPDFGLLYSGLDPEEAAGVVDAIQGQGIAYEMRNGGTSIWVDRDKIYELRMSVAKDGLLGNKQQGFGIFDNEKIGVSPFVQQINKQRAIQDELALSIQTIEGVQSARVILAIPEAGMFTPKGQEATASVTLTITPGYSISTASIAAITNLVSGGITGLSTENVTVVDNRGRLLSNPSDPFFGSGMGGTLQDYKERVELSIQKKAEALLNAALGAGRATVMVTAEVDMKKTSTLTERPSDTAQYALSTEETETTKTSPPEKGQTEGLNESELQTSTKYAQYKTVEQQESLPGSVTSLYVGAVVDLRSRDPNAANPLIMELTEVEEMLKIALGLKEERGDTVKVSNVPMEDPVTAVEAAQPSPWPMYLAIARHASLGVMALCALLVFMVMAKARKKAAQSQIATLGELPAGVEGGLMAAGEAEPAMVRRQIAHALKSNPDQVRQLFASWIQEG